MKYFTIYSMKRLFFTLIFLVTFAVQGQETEVKQTVESFFEAFHQKDTVKLQKVCSKSLRLQSIIEMQLKGTRITEETPHEFYTSLTKMPATVRFEERLLNYTIHVDGAMAIVWTPYEFYVNDKMSHSGVNVFTLYKDNGVWTIISIVDTRRRS